MSAQSNNPPPSVDSTSELGKEDVIELLDKEDEEILDLSDKSTKKTTDKDERTEGDKETDTESEEEDELKAIEEELEEPDEEKLELMTPVRRKEILTKYPQLFKDFPYLERAYYREQQFTEIFPTIDDARETLEKASAFDNFEKQIMDGNIENVLKSVQEENKESFNQIVDDYLPALMRADSNAYYHVLGNVLKDTIITMVRESKEMGENGQPLLSAANILNQFVFGTNKFTAPTRLSSQKDPNRDSREIELEQRERAVVQDQFESTRDDLQFKADNVLKATIDMHIDPKKSMTDYVRKNASREAFESLNSLIVKDMRFRALLDKLWERAFEERFSQSSKDRIKSAYLSKAKTLLPSVIKKARNDALRGLGKRVVDDDSDSDSNEKVDRKGPVTPGKSTSNSSGKIKSAKDIPVGMRSIDFLMQD